MLNFDEVLTRTIGNSDVRIEDVKARPNTNQVYVAVSVGKEGKPALVSVTADGAATAINLVAASTTSVDIKDAPDTGYVFWDKIPERSFTVTDMQWRDGKLYVAGLSNQEFASALRIIPYPFDGKQAMASVKIYHTSHDQIETRARPSAR